jgi:hypothetical protein
MEKTKQESSTAIQENGSEPAQPAAGLTRENAPYREILPE